MKTFVLALMLLLPLSASAAEPVPVAEKAVEANEARHTTHEVGDDVSRLEPAIGEGTTSLGSTSCGNCDLDQNGDLLPEFVEMQEWLKAHPVATTELGSSSN